ATCRSLDLLRRLEFAVEQNRVFEPPTIALPRRDTTTLRSSVRILSRYPALNSSGRKRRSRAARDASTKRLSCIPLTQTSSTQGPRARARRSGIKNAPSLDILEPEIA